MPHTSCCAQTTDTLIRLGEVAASTAGRGFDHILKECLEKVGNFRVMGLSIASCTRISSSLGIGLFPI
jgi:hypothetical protein